MNRGLNLLVLGIAAAPADIAKRGDDRKLASMSSAKCLRTDAPRADNGAETAGFPTLLPVPDDTDPFGSEPPLVELTVTSTAVRGTVTGVDVELGDK